MKGIKNPTRQRKPETARRTNDGRFRSERSKPEHDDRGEIVQFEPNVVAIENVRRGL